jgi:hypothetical protein
MRQRSQYPEFPLARSQAYLCISVGDGRGTPEDPGRAIRAQNARDGDALCPPCSGALTGCRRANRSSLNRHVYRHSEPEQQSRCARSKPLRYNRLAYKAEVAELADAQDLGSCGREAVGVQLPPSAPRDGDECTESNETQLGNLSCLGYERCDGL